jgi:hypothetical protein
VRCSGLRVAYDEGAACGFDDVVSDDGQVVDAHDPLDLGEEPVDQSEVPAGDASDGVNRCRETSRATDLPLSSCADLLVMRNSLRSLNSGSQL